MDKKISYTLITIFLVIMFYFKDNIINNILYTVNTTKHNIQIYITNIQMNIHKHFNQAHQIEFLTKKNKEYQDYIAKISPILLEAKQLKYFEKLNKPNLTFSSVISYAKLPDLTTIYIDYNKSISSPKGLIYNNQTAGVVLQNFKNFSLATLNNNPNTSYTVFIGKDKIPGVLFGGNKVIIKYIPKYHKINIDDIVITSGLDKIFYEGVKVGKVEKIIQTDLYQEVILKPFYNPLHPNFFYVVN